MCAENSICIDLMASAVWRLDRHGSSFKKTCERRSKSAQNWLTRGDVVSHPKSSAGKRGPPSALRNRRGGALAEQFGSVARSFPWSVIAIEALPLMVFIHTPDHHNARPSISARLPCATLRKSSPPRVVCLRRGRSRFCSQSSGKRLCIILFRKRQVATF